MWSRATRSAVGRRCRAPRRSRSRHEPVTLALAPVSSFEPLLPSGGDLEAVCRPAGGWAPPVARLGSGAHRWGLVQMLRRRGAQAAIPGLHPHQLRHTFGHEWLAPRRRGDRSHADRGLEVPDDASGTAPRPPMPAPAKRTGASLPLIGCEGGTAPMPTACLTREAGGGWRVGSAAGWAGMRPANDLVRDSG
jgi:hypothetical protein